MTDPKPDADTPASPHSSPSKMHGDALLDQSGSRQGSAPSESRANDEETGGDAEEKTA